MVADIIHTCDFAISSQCVNVFFLLFSFIWNYRYRLAMDESKSETNVRCCAECDVVRYIFIALYGEK
jgi:hypothetical protein